MIAVVGIRTKNAKKCTYFDHILTYIEGKNIFYLKGKYDHYWLIFGNIFPYLEV